MIPTLRGVHHADLEERLAELDATPYREGGSLRCKGFCHGGDAPDTLKITPTEDRRNWDAHCFKGCDRQTVVQKIQGSGSCRSRTGR